ncbi:MAG TPA: DUF4398 domain-containing protein [Candidatus Bathyarchaeia archaeon]
MRRILAALLVSAMLTLPLVCAQNPEIPGMTLTIYSSGVTRVEYSVESDPNRVRVRVQLPGPPFINMVIRDEEGYPLGSTTSGPNVTVDSIGAQRLFFNYLTGSLTSQEGPTWSVNVTSPVETRIVLPEGAALFDMSDIPMAIGVYGDSQYMDFSPGEIWVYYIVGMRQLEVETRDQLNKTGSYIAEKEDEGYILTEARTTLERAQSSFSRGEYLTSKNDANDALGIAKITVERANLAAQELENAREAVNQAMAQGRLQGLSTADSRLAAAEELMSSGMYVDAKAQASQVYRDALVAVKPADNSMLIYGVLSILVGIGATFFYVIGGRKAPIW